MTLLETVADRMTGGKISRQSEQIADLQEVNRQNSMELQTVQESMTRLEQALNSPQWRLLSFGAENEFSRPGLRLITELARIMKIKNPLIKRGVEIQRLYVWAQGVTITARETAVNEVIQAFLDDERNRAEIGSHQARGEMEENLQQDGNLFFRFFVNQVNGRVRVRTVDPNEIDDIICNPDDKKEPWFYKRIWTKKLLDGTTQSMIEYYPDWRFIPRSKVAFTDKLAALGGLGGRIIWDTPVYHVAVNRVGRWGVCEFYSANDWALAYKNFLEQLASVWQALARWAAKLTGHKSKSAIAATKAKLNTTMASSGEETNPPPVTGSLALLKDGQDLQPFRTAGATMSAEDGRRLLLMAEMVFGFPETFWGDAKVGSLATAKSLDRPTELKIIDRQTLHKDILTNIFTFVLLWAVKAPQGPLRTMGKYVKDPDNDQVIERVDWGNTDANIDITFPAVIEHDVKETIGALLDAQTLQGRSEGAGVPLRTVVQQMLSELGLQNIDEIMKEWDELQAERKARAEEMAAQLQPDQGDDEEQDDPDAEEPDEETEESLNKRTMTAVMNLVTELREGMGKNGHA